MQKTYKSMDQISQSNLTDKKLVECSPNKVSLETEPVSYTHLTLPTSPKV